MSCCLICHLSSDNKINVILRHPKSRLVPAGVQVIFTCIIQNALNPHWLIDGQALLNEQEIITQREGFTIDSQVMENSSTYLSLTINATFDKNGSTIHCSSFTAHSEDALLLVIKGEYIINNCCS